MEKKNRNIHSKIFYSVLLVFIITVTLSFIFNNVPLFLAAIALMSILIYLIIRYGKSVIGNNKNNLLYRYMQFRRKHGLVIGFITVQVILVIFILIERPSLDMRLLVFIAFFEFVILMSSMIVKGILEKESQDKDSSEETSDRHASGK